MSARRLAMHGLFFVAAMVTIGALGIWLDLGPVVE
jgi:hypothetical protein